MSASFAVLFSQLRDYVRTVQKAHPTLAKESDALAYWFCQAALLNPDGVADIKKAIVGYKGNDRAIDVIAIDHLSQNVYIVQVKARQYLMSPSESSAEVCKFANVAQAFKTPSLAEFTRGFTGANKSVQDQASGGLAAVPAGPFQIEVHLGDPWQGPKARAR